MMKIIISDEMGFRDYLSDYNIDDSLIEMNHIVINIDNDELRGFEVMIDESIIDLEELANYCFIN